MSYTAPNIVTSRAHAITTIDPWVLVGMTGSVDASGTWPTQYLAIYLPVIVNQRRVIRKLGIANGAAVSGNLDLGLYDASGTRLVSSGSTAQSGTTTEQVIDVTDTTIGPGFYYLAACFDNTTGTVRRISLPIPLPAGAGALTETLGSVTLPATATWAVDATLAIWPIFFAFFGTTVA